MRQRLDISQLVRPLLSIFRTDDVPALARTNYVAEVRQMALWGVVVGVAEGNLVSTIVSKTFNASEWLTSVVWALPFLMNVLNLAWGALLRGRRRKTAFLAIATCGLLVAGSVGLTPMAWGQVGGWIFAGQIALTHLFLSGLVTLRTTIWAVNYPQYRRAQIASRLQMLRLGISSLAAGGLGLMMDVEPGLYRFAYPLAAVAGFVSLVPLRRLRVRGEKASIRRVREHMLRSGTANRHPIAHFFGSVREAGSILATDRLFARFMLAQFLLGAANFFTDPILINVLTKRLDFDYFSTQSVMQLVPTLLLLTSIQLWARFFDRVSVLRFRVYNSACWAAAYACVAVSMILLHLLGPSVLPIAITILVIGRIMNGLGRGGGAIAWNLGHLHFAREHQTELYMGIHVGLTGLRALLMPTLGTLAYHWLDKWCFVIGVVLAFSAFLLFRRLAAEEEAAKTAGGALRSD